LGQKDPLTHGEDVQDKEYRVVELLFWCKTATFVWGLLRRVVIRVVVWRVAGCAVLGSVLRGVHLWLWSAFLEGSVGLRAPFDVARRVAHGDVSGSDRIPKPAWKSGVKRS
jgi:hypothetical protein